MDSPNDALLQLGLFTATFALLAVSFTTHNTSQWYLTFLYVLTFWCFTTLVFVRYVPQWVNNSMGVLMLLLAVTSGIGAYVNYHLPYSSQKTRDRINQWFAFGTVVAFLVVLGFWYFDNSDKAYLRQKVKETEAKVDTLRSHQWVIEKKADRNAHKADTIISLVKGQQDNSDSLIQEDIHAQRDAEKAFQKKFKY